MASKHSALCPALGAWKRIGMVLSTKMVALRTEDKRRAETKTPTFTLAFTLTFTPSFETISGLSALDELCSPHVHWARQLIQAVPMPGCHETMYCNVKLNGTHCEAFERGSHEVGKSTRSVAPARKAETPGDNLRLCSSYGQYDHVGNVGKGEVVAAGRAAREPGAVHWVGKVVFGALHSDSSLSIDLPGVDLAAARIASSEQIAVRHGSSASPRL